MGNARSGRRTAIEDLDYNELLKLSMKLQLKFFKSPDIPFERKVDIASRYLVRRLPDAQTEQANKVTYLAKECLEDIRKALQAKNKGVLLTTNSVNNNESNPLYIVDNSTITDNANEQGQNTLPSQHYRTLNELDIDKDIPPVNSIDTGISSNTDSVIDSNIMDNGVKRDEKLEKSGGTAQPPNHP